MNTLHERLKEERLRLGLSQDEFAEKGGVKRRAQIHYEAGERCPDGHYFAGIAATGADVNYILTGKRESNAVKVNMQAVKMAQLLNELNDHQQKEILFAIEEKKRLNQLESRFNQMQAA